MLWATPPMQSVSNDNFGALIAYLVPGATALAGFSQFSPPLRSWFGATPVDAPTIGGFLYLTAASLAMGMTINAVRWGIVDVMHGLTGVPPPRLSFATLHRKVEALRLLIEIHYRHYQFYANMFVAMAFAYVCYRVKAGGLLPVGWLDVAFVLLEGVFFITSRDTLRKYYIRSQQLLAPTRGARRSRIC